MELCTQCIYYDPYTQMCGRVMTDVRPKPIPAKLARKNPDKCGPMARFFFPKPSPIITILNDDEF